MTGPNARTKTVVSKLFSVESASSAPELRPLLPAPAADRAQPSGLKVRKRHGVGVQSGHQDGENNLHLDFIESIQTLKDACRLRNRMSPKKKD